MIYDLSINTNSTDCVIGTVSSQMIGVPHSLQAPPLPRDMSFDFKKDHTFNGRVIYS